jgi:hypothetical protein
LSGISIVVRAEDKNHPSMFKAIVHPLALSFASAVGVKCAAPHLPTNRADHLP